MKMNRKRRASLAMWVPTPFHIVRKMLELAQVGEQDVVYDLGCGDGRILAMAVDHFGARRAVGYELRPDLYQGCRQEIEQQNLQAKVTLVRGQLLDANLSEASVVTIYLSTRANRFLGRKFEGEAKPGTRIVSYRFRIERWLPTSEVMVYDYHFGGWCSIYLYVVPQAFQRLA